MKAQDLQINDLVRRCTAVERGNLGYVKIISVMGARGMIYYNDLQDSSPDPVSYRYDPENLAGIPLTEEMLKRNGFKTSKQDFYNDVPVMIEATHETPAKCITIFSNPYGGDWGYNYWSHVSGERLTDFRFCHVHQLQKLLRICGEKDLADNFAVLPEKQPEQPEQEKTLQELLADLRDLVHKFELEQF